MKKNTVNEIVKEHSTKNKKNIKASIKRIEAEGGNIGGEYALLVLRLALKGLENA